MGVHMNEIFHFPTTAHHASWHVLYVCQVLPTKLTLPFLLLISRTVISTFLSEKCNWTKPGQTAAGGDSKSKVVGRKVLQIFVMFD